MTLLPPVVEGPLSECNSSIEVSGVVTGAQVQVLANGRVVVDAVATWSRQVFPLLPGAKLNPGETVVAMQGDGSGFSKQTPLPNVTVQSKTPPGPLAFKAPPYDCAQAVWVVGAVPGATVNARSGAMPMGSTDAPRGEARLFLSSPLGRGGVLTVSQVACGATSGDTNLPAAEPLPASVPAPTIGEPLRECQRSIGVSGVLTGALVTVNRKSGITDTAYFDYPALIFTSVPPLQRGDVLTARQEFAACQAQSGPSKPVTVEPNTPVPAPVIIGPLCPGSTGVKLAGLLPGSRVAIFSDATEIGEAEAPDSTFVFPVPGLLGGATITAKQELCKDWSDPSNKVKVSTTVNPPVPPVIVGPLYGCGGAVHVKATPGSWVILTSKQLGGEIGRTFASESEIDIEVAPLQLRHREHPGHDEDRRLRPGGCLQLQLGQGHHQHLDARSHRRQRVDLAGAAGHSIRRVRHLSRRRQHARDRAPRRSPRSSDRLRGPRPDRLSRRRPDAAGLSPHLLRYGRRQDGRRNVHADRALISWSPATSAQRLSFSAGVSGSRLPIS
ncbi:MAG: hypothetical protein M3O15_15510 [Acidobacteriota bacterium]|nr:hypothetical protein [Acidobacteriota bacterium]